MSLTLVQAGHGPRRILVLAFFVANRTALLASLPSSACVVIDVNDADGRFARPVGRGGVDTLATVRDFARARAGATTLGAEILIGWSAGCQAVREQLRAGATPEAVLALDGISGDVPPRPDQLDPWIAEAARARAGESCFVIAHTAMTYMERRPPGSRYASTTRTALLIARTIGAPPPASGAIHPIDGGLYVLAYSSADIDGTAHKNQQGHAMPDLLARIVLPWLADRGLELDPAAPAPATPRDPSVVPPPVLRVGSRGQAVTEWQAVLRMRGYPVAADGTFGESTAAATRALQRRLGLTVDGVVGPKTRAAAEASASEDELPDTEPAPVVKPPASAHLPALTEAGKDKAFGVVVWTPDEPPAGQIRITNGYRSRFDDVEIPELRGVPYAPASGIVTMHREVCQPLADLFAAWREAGLMHLVKAWSGGLAFRRVRGGVLLSSHARGIAFDLNAPGLPLGKKDPGAGKPWSVAELAPIARELGWFWGNDFSRPDPMHYERSRL